MEIEIRSESHRRTMEKKHMRSMHLITVKSQASCFKALVKSCLVNVFDQTQNVFDPGLELIC